MAGQLDEGVVKLEQFIGVLRTTVDRVGETTDALESQAGDLDDLESTVESGFEDLNDALEEFEDDLDSARQDAVDELGELTTLAREAGDQRLAEAESEVESAESSFADAMTEGRAELDQAHSALGSQGFHALVSTIDGVESALDASRGEGDQAFEGLDAGLTDFTERAGESFREAEGKFDEGVSDLSDKFSSLVTEAGDCVRGFTSDGTDFNGEMTSLGGELVSLYEGWDGDIDGEAADLISSVKGLMDDTATFVETEGKDQVEAPADLTLNESFAPCLEELGEAQDVLDAAAAGPAEMLVPLGEELVKAQSVIDTIDQLLNAVE
jgi:vacuolar-type H+-ATPase subunit H